MVTFAVPPPPPPPPLVAIMPPRTRNFVVAVVAAASEVESSQTTSTFPAESAATFAFREKVSVDGATADAGFAGAPVVPFRFTTNVWFPLDQTPTNCDGTVLNAID